MKGLHEQQPEMVFAEVAKIKALVQEQQKVARDLATALDKIALELDFLAVGLEQTAGS